jgi:hypothetical protein
LIVALVAIIGFSFAACGGDDNNDDNGGSALQPTITVQPQSRVYFPGVTAAPLTVTASASDGGTMSYQWYSRTVTYGSGTAIEGATTASYVPPTNTAGTVYYGVRVTNTNQGKTAELSSDYAEIVTGFKEAEKFLSEVRSAAFGGNRFVVGRAYGQTAWSSDGINWTEVDSSNVFGNISSVNGIAYGGGRFIATGGYKMGWSTNGESWTVIDASPAFNGTSDFVDGITYGNNRFFVWGSGTKTAYSDDNGATWTAVNANQAIVGGGIVAGRMSDDRFIRFGGTYTAAGGTYAYLEYYTNTYWQGDSILDLKDRRINNMLYANNILYATTGNKVFKYVTSNWTDTSPSSILGQDYSINSIGYGAGRLIVFASEGSMGNYTYKGAWSDDNGTNWTELPLEKSYNRIVYGNGCFITIGGNSVYYTVYQ